MAGSALALLVAQTSFGIDTYVGLVPNGSSFSCSTCHVASGPPNRNPFGTDFANNGHVWNAALAQLDSDKDGYTNGEELGDPNGTWTTHNQNPPGPVYNPGDPGSHPSGAPGGAAPVITTQPASQTVNAGANVTFTVVAAGSSLTYQWKKDGLNLAIAGATTATLTLNNVTSLDAGQYTVVVSNSGGSTTSAAATLRVRSRHKK